MVLNYTVSLTIPYQWYLAWRLNSLVVVQETPDVLTETRDVRLVLAQLKNINVELNSLILRLIAFFLPTKPKKGYPKNSSEMALVSLLTFLVHPVTDN